MDLSYRFYDLQDREAIQADLLHQCYLADTARGRRSCRQQVALVPAVMCAYAGISAASLAGAILIPITPVAIACLLLAAVFTRALCGLVRHGRIIRAAYTGEPAPPDAAAHESVGSSDRPNRPADTLDALDDEPSAQSRPSVRPITFAQPMEF